MSVERRTEIIDHEIEAACIDEIRLMVKKIAEDAVAFGRLMGWDIRMVWADKDTIHLLLDGKVTEVISCAELPQKGE